MRLPADRSETDCGKAPTSDPVALRIAEPKQPFAEASALASNSSEMAQRLALSEIDDGVRELLRQFKPKLLPHLSNVISKLYDRIKQIPTLSRYFSSEAHVARTSALQLGHWQLLLEAHFDDQYLASARQIGNVHWRLGLEPRWYIGAYSFILSNLFHAMENAELSRWPRRKQIPQVNAVIRALIKVSMLDMEIALSAYFEEAQQTETSILRSMALTFEDGLAQLVRNLNVAVAELSSSAQKQASAAEDARAQSERVSNGSADANGIIQHVSRGAAILAETLQSVSGRIQQSSRILVRAVAEAETIKSQVSGLDASVDRIGATVDLIQEIAERTRLLALNATIEAARAGTAGRGFSVVASEVQQLAIQTAHATTNIKTRIDHITSSSAQVSQSVSMITATMNEMRNIEGSIVSSVEEHEHAAVTMARHVDDGARFSSQIAQSIGAVSRLIERVSMEASQSLRAITDLVDLTSKIDIGVEQFVKSITVTR